MTYLRKAIPFNLIETNELIVSLAPKLISELYLCWHVMLVHFHEKVKPI